MAENQDVVMSPSEASVTDEQPKEAVEDSPSQTGKVESSTATAPSDMAWVGAVKKESRKKGFDDGYRQAQEAMRNALAEPETVARVTTSSAPEPQNLAKAASGPSQIPTEQIQAAAQQAQLQNRFGQIAQLGAAKYPDYQEKMGAYIQQAQEREQNQDPDLSVLMTMAANFGNEDIVYKVATDENFRNDVLQSNPKLWSQKLLQAKITSPTSPHVNGTPTIKVSAAPIGTMPKASSYGAMQKLSSAEKRLRQKQLASGDI